MTYKEVMLSIYGLRSRDKMLEGWIRRATFIIGASNFGGKGVSAKFSQMWPVEGEAGLRVSDAAKRQLKKFREKAARLQLDTFREAAAMKRAKQKVDGRA